MSTLTRVSGQSVYFSSKKPEKLTGADSETITGEPTVIASTNRQVSLHTDVTTLVLTSAGTGLPTLSLEDVIKRSGVNSGAEVMVVTEGKDSEPGVEIAQADSTQQIQDAISAIESTGAVLVEVETTNNEQTVTVRAADIDTLYTQASAQSAGTLASGVSNILLLKNGWAYTDMQSSPLSLAVEPSGLTPGDSWALWRSTNEGLHEIQDALTGVWNSIVGQKVDTSPKSAEDVAGVFKSYSADTQLIYSATSTSTLQLSPDGIFTNTYSSTITNENGHLDATYTLHTFGSAAGRGSSFSGSVESNGSTRATASSSETPSTVAGDMFGSYRILEDGVTLELQFADGSSKQQLFFKTENGRLTVDGQRFINTGNASANLVQDLMELLLANGDEDHWVKALKALAEASANAMKLTALPEQENVG